MKEVMTDKKPMSSWEVGNGAVINTIDCMISSAKAIAYAKVSLQVNNTAFYALRTILISQRCSGTTLTVSVCSFDKRNGSSNRNRADTAVERA
jgi:hypothetical protein